MLKNGNMLVEKVGWEHSSKEMGRRKLVQTGRGDEYSFCPI